MDTVIYTATRCCNVCEDRFEKTNIFFYLFGIRDISRVFLWEVMLRSYTKAHINSRTQDATRSQDPVMFMLVANQD